MPGRIGHVATAADAVVVAVDGAHVGQQAQFIVQRLAQHAVHADGAAPRFVGAGVRGAHGRAGAFAGRQQVLRIDGVEADAAAQRARSRVGAGAGLDIDLFQQVGIDAAQVAPVLVQAAALARAVDADVQVGAIDAAQVDALCIAGAAADADGRFAGEDVGHVHRLLALQGLAGNARDAGQGRVRRGLADQLDFGQGRQRRRLFGWRVRRLLCKSEGGDGQRAGAKQEQWNGMSHGKVVFVRREATGREGAGAGLRSVSRICYSSAVPGQEVARRALPGP
ncbi:hypothetical protein D3C87_991450 [compost metagenome]